MIFGVGTDVCDVRRIRASLERHGERFAAKVLSDAELATWKARSARWPERGIRYLATRFSAKEASGQLGGNATWPTGFTPRNRYPRGWAGACAFP